MRTALQRLAGLALASAGLSGCSILSPVPLWEVTKVAGSAAGVAIDYGPSRASQTVYHLHPSFRQLCIEFNPDAPTEEIVPALQAELRSHQVDSRVYERGSRLTECRVWLRYAAQIEWGSPPFRDGWRPYLSSAALTLQTADGTVLSSSRYELDGGVLASGKWTATRSKLAPVVTALLTGFEN